MRKTWIDPKDNALSLNDQLRLASICKASYYYQPIEESEENLSIMNEIDRIYTESPFYGSRRMVVELFRRGMVVNRKRVIRLMRQMGIQAIFPRRSLTKPRSDHKKYPYLLDGIVATRPHQVWATDITYIRLTSGYLYLTAIMDWYSRLVLSWEISNTLDTDFCIDALESAMNRFGAPEIFNSDQGCQFTSNAFVEKLCKQEVKISMTGKGRCYDNIFVERLWRSLKHEDVYIKRYETGQEAHRGIGQWINFYNDQRVHQSLDYATPREFYEAAG